MRCLNPRTVGFQADGKTICWSPKRYDKQYPVFQLPCGKCIECRMERARDTATRCVHEAKMYPQNCFLTLTYSEQHLESPRLIYSHWQSFMADLRDKVLRDTLKTIGLTREQYLGLPKDRRNEIYAPIQIGALVTGEYGDQLKRPHWHAILFNYNPPDLCHPRTTERGDKAYRSPIIEKLWGRGKEEIGNVSFESAGYVARYALKKLIHGQDQDHDFHPIHKRSSKQAIGKKFIEKYWQETFNNGFCILDHPSKGPLRVPIPRYYEKWLKKHQPDAWVRYVTELKAQLQRKAELKEERLKKATRKINDARIESGKGTHQITRNQVRKKITEERFKRLQKHLKGDI